ncbi:hypothetical protein QS257_10880 [Terrilactibacillus sp. S3-3]|nr:hypothetical protein QS257_10880 [Terrilactibacillus sp. S3-3]
MTDAKSILLSEADLADGILIHDEMDKHRVFFIAHSFIDDIIVSARNIAARYNSDEEHIRVVEKNMHCISLIG